MRISVSNKPVACITMGYPAGIGPQIIANALASPAIRRLANFLIIGDESVFKKALNIEKVTLRYGVAYSAGDIDFKKTPVVFYDLKNITQKGFRFARVSASYGGASIAYIDKAVSLIKAKKADILITAPIHKHAAMMGGFKYPGHTEYLAHLTGTKDFCMMFVGGQLKIVLATIHIPVKDVSRSITRVSLVKALRLSDNALRRYFNVKSPVIGVCGLNPHAGESGIMGREEKNIIAPAVNIVRRRGICAVGPASADSLFYKAVRGDYDCLLCMYHDQGLVPLKMIARDESSNITIGLPFIRTSPAHGSALDIAGTRKVSSKGMASSIKTAVLMYYCQRNVKRR